MNKIIAFILVLLVVFSIGVKNKMNTNIEPTKKPEIQKEEMNTIQNVGFNKYDSNLINYVDKTFLDKNYSVSPISLKYALALVTYGAEGETQAELLNALGFDTIGELEAWIYNIEKDLKYFETSAQYKNKNLKEELNWMQEYLSEEEKDKYKEAMNEDILDISNSIWHNIDKPGQIKMEYAKKMESLLSAAVNNVNSSEMEEKINSWVNEKTYELIPRIVNENVSEMNTVLVNTVYMKDTWANKFDKYNTKEMDFTTINNEIVKKEMMNQQNDFGYYEDNNSKLLIMPMEHNIKFVFVMGDNSNISNKIINAKTEKVNVYIPKFDIETSFEDKELVNFLKDNGVKLAFDDENADFSNMIEGADIKIDDILQKTKVKIYEDGAEAAAVTAIMMENTSISIENKKTKEFKADKPFSFYIYLDGDLEDNLLFYGQIVK